MLHYMYRGKFPYHTVRARWCTSGGGTCKPLYLYMHYVLTVYCTFPGDLLFYRMYTKQTTTTPTCVTYHIMTPGGRVIALLKFL